MNKDKDEDKDEDQDQDVGSPNQALITGEGISKHNTLMHHTTKHNTEKRTQ